MMPLKEEIDWRRQSSASDSSTTLSLHPATFSFKLLYNALCVWIEKPQVCNKYIYGADIGLYTANSECTANSEIGLLDFRSERNGIKDENSTSTILPLSKMPDIFSIWRKFVLKDTTKKCADETIIINKFERHVIFIPNIEENHGAKNAINVVPTFPYRFIFCGGNTMPALEVDKRMEKIQCEWLKNDLFPNICKWFLNPAPPKAPSLRLINISNYYELYVTLKEKYAESLISDWPERTDPKKFVHEDIAIAAYLITYWNTKKTKQVFVDLGCGNGLLVYILTKEGYSGYGIDIRARKIWDMYGDGVVLKVSDLTPIEEQHFAEADWIIGNHSDELTPWIPYLSAMSNYTCQCFLLPCCAHDLFGKFNKRSSGSSVYESYRMYIEKLCGEFGFSIVTDQLRIPSTKRHCIITTGRTYDECEQEMNGDRLRMKIEALKSLTGKEFIARAVVEPVRNCTRLDEDVKCEIVGTCISMLLDADRVSRLTSSYTGSSWRVGGNISLGDLAKRLGRDKLNSLKEQCGGLQTLLRNHKHYFKVHRGMVCLRMKSTSELKSKVNIKSTAGNSVSGGDSVGDSVKSGGNSVGDSVKSGGESVGDSVKSGGESVGDSVKSGGNCVGDSVKSGGESVGDSVKSGGESVGDSVKSGGESVGDSVKSGGESVSGRNSVGVSVKSGGESVSGGNSVGVSVKSGDSVSVKSGGDSVKSGGDSSVGVTAPPNGRSTDKICYFYLYHPDGCPYHKSCLFKHYK